MRAIIFSLVCFFKFSLFAQVVQIDLTNLSKLTGNEIQMVNEDDKPVSQKASDCEKLVILTQKNHSVTSVTLEQLDENKNKVVSTEIVKSKLPSAIEKHVFDKEVTKGVLDMGGVGKPLLTPLKDLRVIVKDGAKSYTLVMLDKKPMEAQGAIELDLKWTVVGDRLLFIKDKASLEEAVRGTEELEPGYLIRINGGNHRLKYFSIDKNGKEQLKSLQKFHPSVGSQIAIQVTGLDLEQERVSVETNFSDHNLELGETFSALIGSGGSESATTSSKAGPVAQTEINPNPTETLAVQEYCQFSAEMKQLYDFLSSTTIYNRNTVTNMRKEVDMKTALRLGFDPSLGTSIIDKGNELRKLLAKESQDAFDLIIARAATYYKLIGKVGDQNRLPLQVDNQDDLDVTVKFFDNTGTTPTDEKTYTIWTKCGLKIDFSSGFIGTKLVNDEFFTTTKTRNDTSYFVNPVFVTTDSITAITEVTDYYIQRKSGSDISIGAGLLVHLYSRWGGWVNPSLTAGFMIKDDAVTNYLLGVSLILGHKGRWVLSGGQTIGKVDRLRDTYYDGGPIKFADGGSTDVPTDSKWDNNWYFGLSFNFLQTRLGGKKKDSAGAASGD